MIIFYFARMQYTRDVNVVNCANFFLAKIMLNGLSNQMQSKMPIPNCKEISFLSNDNKYHYNNYYTYIFYFLNTVYKYIIVKSK